MEWLGAIAAPADPGQMVVSYLFWVALFITVNVVWDIRSPRTREFQFYHIGEKGGVVMSATTFCSSLLVLVSLFNEQTSLLIGNTAVPLVIAGFVGLLQSVVALCPYSAQVEALNAANNPPKRGSRGAPKQGQ